MKTDVVIIGAGPAGIFTAIEMLRLGSKKKIVIVEKGQPVEKRRCPKIKTGKCMNCKPYCHITTGFSGILRGDCTVVVKWWSKILATQHAAFLLSSFFSTFKSRRYM